MKMDAENRGARMRALASLMEKRPEISKLSKIEVSALNALIRNPQCPLEPKLEGRLNDLGLILPVGDSFASGLILSEEGRIVQEGFQALDEFSQRF